MALRWRETLGPAIVQHRVVECSRPYGGIEAGDRFLQGGNGQSQRRGKFRDAWRRDWRIERGHEHLERIGVKDDPGDLARLLGHQAPPDGVAFRPDILALVVEARRL